jgi:extradiol dioxygenase family protein
MNLTPFHIAVAVRDIDETREFYGNQLGFPEGRSAENWIDFNMFGHQFVTHLNPEIGPEGKVPALYNPVDNHGVPIPHCGVIMQFDDWQAFAKRLEGVITEYIIEPYIRFKGLHGEQGTLFFADPSGNALEFKGFRDIETELFKK